MPFIKFTGVNQKLIEKYFNEVDQIATLISANPENIILISEKSSVFSKLKMNQKTKSILYVSVEWKTRTDKQELLAKHIYDFFKTEVEKVFVFFTNVDEMLYVNGIKS